MNPLVRIAQALLNTAWRATRRSAPASSEKAIAGAYPVSGTGGWWSLIREPFTGAWQRNVEVRVDSVLTYSAVFRCITLISSDIAKLRLRLVAKDANGIWEEVEANSPFWPVLRKPNRYQTRIQFFKSWVQSKLVHGNTYVLKERDARGVVMRLYVLDPHLVTVLVAEDGSVYYQLRTDQLAGLKTPNITVPASEIIHDVYTTINHPLVGISPIHAAGLAALAGLRIQESSTQFFAAGANPGGVLSAPGHINDDTARRLKEYWDSNYGAGGPSVGKVAVLGDGLKYEPMMMTATDAQLLEQLKWTAEVVASTFGVPAHMIGIGQPPTYNNIEALQTQYYSQCLQILIEDIEILLDEGLGLGAGVGNPYGTEFDKEDLLLMDSKTLMEVVGNGVQRGIYAPDEARFRFNLKPVPGGDSPYLQEQNWPLKHLAERPLPSREPTAPEEIEDDGSSADATGDDGDKATAERRSNVIHFRTDRVLRRAAAIGRAS